MIAKDPEGILQQKRAQVFLLYCRPLDFLLHYLPDPQTLGAAGYGFLLLIVFLESFVYTGFFVPGAVLTVLMGGLAAHGYYGFWVLVGLCTLGTAVGDGISYEVGRRNHHLLDRWPRIASHLQRAKDFAHRHKGKSIVFGRFFSWTRPIMPFVIGVASMPRAQFYLFAIPTCFLWSLAHLGLGYVFGTAWKVALLWSTRALFVVIVVAILLALVAWLWRWLIAYGRQAMPHIHTQLLGLRGDFLMSAFAQKHPEAAHWLLRRLHLQRFTGLPLTLLSLLLVALGMVFFGVAVDVITGEPITVIDTNVVSLAYALRSPTLLDVSYFLTLFGSTELIVTGGIVLTAGLLLQRQRLEALVLWCMLGVVLLTTTGSKLLFHRPRPSGLFPALETATYSFPSGHALAATALYGFLAYLLLRSNARWGAKISGLMTVLLLLVCVGASRVALGVHYPTDVLAGYTAGVMVLVSAISVNEWLHTRLRQPTLRFATSLFVTVSLLQLLCVVVAVVWKPAQWKDSVLLPDRLIPTVESPTSLFQRGALPAMSETLLGERHLPVNLLFIAKERCLPSLLTQAGFVPSRPIDVHTFEEIFRSALLQRPYPAAPLTPSFSFGQPQSLGFTKFLLGNGDRRIQLRIWETPYTVANGREFLASAVVMERRPGLLLRRRSIQANAARDQVVATLSKYARFPLEIITLPKGAQDSERVTTDGVVDSLILPACPAETVRNP